MKKSIVLVIGMLFVLVMFSGCGKLEDKVTQKESRIKIKTSVNLVNFFECEEGVMIAIKDDHSFDINKAGKYSVDAVILEGDKQVEKTYVFEVYDDEKPVIECEDAITLYEKDKFVAEEKATCTDNSGEDIRLQVVENNVDTNNAGEYSVKYQAADSSGNTEEKTMNVTVKKVHSFSERKALVKELLKKKEYNLLEMEVDNNKKLVWAQMKESFSPVEKGNYYYYINPYLSISQTEKVTSTKLFVEVFYQDKKDYVSPKNIYIRSDKGTIETDQNSVDFDYEYSYVYSNFSDMSYYFTEKSDLDKLCDEILQGSSLKIATYTDKNTLEYTCKSKEISKMKQLMNFYKELQSNF